MPGTRSTPSKSSGTWWTEEKSGGQSGGGGGGSAVAAKKPPATAEGRKSTGKKKSTAKKGKKGECVVFVFFESFLSLCSPESGGGQGSRLRVIFFPSLSRGERESVLVALCDLGAWVFV